MSQREDKLGLERAFVDGFAALSNVFRTENLTRCAKDPPDFILGECDNRVSIEVTRAFVDGPGPSALRESWANQRRVCDNVRRSIAASNLAPLLVFIGFARDELRLKPNRLADRIVEFIVHDAPASGKSKVLNWQDYFERGEYRTKWPEDLDHISVLGLSADAQHVVQHTPAGFEATHFPDILQSALDSKAADLPRYAADFDRTWLLIVAEGHNPASLLNPSLSTKTHQFTSAFDRAFFYRHYFPTWFELRLANPS